ncbi:MAG: hypothetical protein RBS73_08985 [Prolixibacteraceae bacterium]|jgi:hypothetical protein|nr:hypothetical protein [Prolixibacteraceae bacterium]
MIINRIAIFFLCIGFWGNVSGLAVPKQYDLYSFRQVELSAPWLGSGNAAGLSYIPDLFPAELKLGFGLNKGGFHSVLEGGEIQDYTLSFQSFQKINKTYLYGSLNYWRGFEKELNFSNLNSPLTNYPYLMADTIGNDTCDREFIALKGMVSSPLTDRLSWGVNFGYEVGVAVQDRDPRSENKILRMNVSPGFIWRSGNYKFGANLDYEYYNEDMEVGVVEKNKQHTMFMMHGLGNFIYHQAGSFYRLYQQHQMGCGVQVDFASGDFSNLLHTRFDYLRQRVDDGRAGGNANWSYVKNDAKIDGINWNIADVATFVEGRKTHQAEASLQIESRLGTEYVQRLEKVGPTDLERWITYAENQKYYSVCTHAELIYRLINKNGEDRISSLLTAGLNYTDFGEKYYLPDFNQDYSNLKLSASWLKRFNAKKANLSAELRFSCQLNLKAGQNLDFSDPLVQKIYVPEFNYRTSDFFIPGTSLAYEIPVKKIVNMYFIKTDFNWWHSTAGNNRTVLNFTAGIIF